MDVPSQAHRRASYPFSFIPLRPFCYCFPLTNTLARPPRNLCVQRLALLFIQYMYKPTNQSILVSHSYVTSDEAFNYLSL